MKHPAKTTYTHPHLSVTEFEAADVVMLSYGSDDNQGTWQPASEKNNLPVDDLQIENL